LPESPKVCPICGSKMENGSIIVGGNKSQPNGNSEVFWADQVTGSLEFAVWMQRFPITIADAYRCQNCKMIMLPYEKGEGAEAKGQHEQMLLMYKYFYGGGAHILEQKIEDLRKQGMSLEEAVRKLVQQEKPNKEE